MRRKPAPRAFPGFAAGCATLVGVSSVLVSAVEPEADMPGVMVVPAELGGLGVACLSAERDGGGIGLALRCGEGEAAVGGPRGVPPRKCGVRDTCKPIAICSMVGREENEGWRAMAAVGLGVTWACGNRSAGVACDDVPYASFSISRKLPQQATHPFLLIFVRTSSLVRVTERSSHSSDDSGQPRPCSLAPPLVCSL